MLVGEGLDKAQQELGRDSWLGSVPMGIWAGGTVTLECCLFSSCGEGSS